VTTSAPALQRAEGLDLLGALDGSGYRAEAFLVRRADGQTIQLTALLYRLLELLDGSRTPPDLAADLSAAVDRTVSVDDIEHLTAKLTDLGLLHGSAPEVLPSSNPLLALRWKVVASDPATTRRLTGPFAALFHPAVLWPVLAAFVCVCWFVLVDKGLASATHQAFTRPGLLLAVFALSVLSAGFHELGHAAACRFGGAQPGAMGAGLYLVWPAFYTNVDDSYRLNRRGRLRVDLGGLYFNAVVAVAVTGLWLATGQDALLLGVATQLLQMVRQLAPVVRADGYHILADLTGVPDLFSHLGPTVRRVLPSQWGTPSPLTRKARLLVTAWVLVVVPVLLSLMLTAILLLPRLIATAWTSGQALVTRLGDNAQHADILGVGADLLQLLALLLPVVGTGYLAVSVSRRTSTRAWTATQDRPVARTAFLAAASVLLAALAWAWWPTGQYVPVRGDERGTVTSLVSSSRPASATTSGSRQLALAMVPRGAAAADHPVLLVIKDGSGLRSIVTSGNGHAPAAAKAFPFALPTRPGPGDTQALAVNDTDGSVVYDVSYALVTVTDGAPVTSSNTAYALASCTACTTVAVSFQVVLVVGHSSIVAPVNAAVAANGACVRCLTTAMAVQLVVSISAAPPADVQTRLDAALAGLDGVEGLDPAVIYQRVQQIETQVVTILQDAGLLTTTPTPAGTAVATATPTGSAAASATPEPVSSDPSQTASPSVSPSSSASPSPSAAPTRTAAPTAAPSATATASP
jgi:putative peptide zinc metalloprotease protein